MKLSLTVLLLAAAVLGGSRPAWAQDDTLPMLQPKLIAVKIHADWCSRCKKMGTVFQDLQKKFSDQQVLFIVLDVTDATAKNNAFLLASALGINSILAKKIETGYIMIVDATQRTILTRLTSDQDLSQMVAEIKKYL